MKLRIIFRGEHSPKTNMTMEKQPFEDLSPLKNVDFPASHVSFQGNAIVWIYVASISSSTFDLRM